MGGLWVQSLTNRYSGVIMSAMASQITSLTIVYSTVYSGADQRKYQSTASLAFVRGIHRWPVTSPHKGPVTRKTFPFDDVIMKWRESRMRSTHLDLFLRTSCCSDPFKSRSTHSSEQYYTDPIGHPKKDIRCRSNIPVKFQIVLNKTWCADKPPVTTGPHIIIH